MDVVANGHNKPTRMVIAFVYGGPRVGDDSLKKVFQKDLSAADGKLMRANKEFNFAEEIVSNPLQTPVMVTLIKTNSGSLREITCQCDAQKEM
ncbi:hypothetical protein CCACVL1_04515 [Corchorus capsularis]|uniref:Uncharacterized protein n=1 Tax=Corchorus capsularis TaxID=210143 RepID=A0A1R3JRS3_COCAP|nr:hypothetical protein CCACVL1_04515 [Corchorus capsularis]